MMTTEDGLARQSTSSARRNPLANRKLIGICIVVVFAVAIVFGGVHSALEVIEATSSPMMPASDEYVPRLAAESSDDPAMAALKYVCLFH